MTTSEGTIELDLFDDDAPKTVENFTKLAGEGYYDGLTARRELSSLARIADDELVISDGTPEGGHGALTAVAGNVVAILPLAGMVDLDAERDRLRKEIAAATGERDRAQSQLGNEAFVAKAPDHVIEVQRRRLATATEQISLLERRLKELDA